MTKAAMENLHRRLAADPVRILLTGAAGLIGGEMAARLTAAGHGVVGLVRHNSEIRANNGRLLDAPAYAGEIPGAGEMVIISGDISMPRLGLTEQQQQQLCAHIDLVIHCAAITTFDAAPEQYEAINVNGTANVRAFIPDTRFLHVSTAYVCGTKDGVIAEAPHDPHADFTNGYEASKAKAETDLIASGGDIVIARPSIVIGAHACGTIRSFDTIYAVFRLIAEGRISILPAAHEATLDFVPIDHVADGLMDIISHWEAAKGKVIHLSSGAPIDVQRLADVIGSFGQLDKPMLVHPDQFSLNDLPPKQRRLYQRTASFYASYFRRNPRFVTDNLHILGGRTCPSIDEAALKRMISYCVKSGFLRASRLPSRS